MGIFEIKRMEIEKKYTKWGNWAGKMRVKDYVHNKKD